MFVDLSKAPNEYKRQAAMVLLEASQSVTSCWETLEAAEAEVAQCCQEEYIAVGYVEDGELAGWVGLRPMYGNVTWELHPIMVKPACQGRGVGSKLLHEVERRARERGVLNIVLGTDDELGQTSMSQVDLCEANIFHEIENIRSLGSHPFEFYRKNGYTIIGVIPDASGPRKPDILMWKRI